jgi:branched-chain amino acid transport system permease protein
MKRVRRLVSENRRNPNAIVYVALGVAALGWPVLVTSLGATNLIGLAADAGVFILLALGLNVVIGFAGLLDLGYAAFWAIGAYTAGLFASQQLAVSPIGHEVHIAFWLLVPMGACIAAGFGVLLGAPTLRLRGDYLAIVTLGFGEIVPLVFTNLGLSQKGGLGDWTSGPNGITVDQPSLPFWFTGPWAGQNFGIVSPFPFSFDPVAFYVVMVILVFLCVLLVNNLYRSRLGRAWMAIREDEVAAAAMGVNTRNVKLLAFSMGAFFAGIAGVYYGSKLSLVTPENFKFVYSVSIVVMVVLGGMGNIPGVIVGALAIYFIQYDVLTNLPAWASSAAQSVGLGFLNQPNGSNWIGLHDEVQRLNYLVFGLILVLFMLLRPQGLLPSRARAQELATGDVAEESVFEVQTAAP